MHDDAADNREYTTNLLFVNAYFKHGPGYDMVEDTSNQNSDPTHWTALLSNWIKSCMSSDFVQHYPHVSPAVFVPASSIVYALGGYPDSSPQALASTLKQSLGELARWNIQEDFTYLRSAGQLIWYNSL